MYEATQKLGRSTSHDRVESMIDSRVVIENISVQSEMCLSTDKVESLKAADTSQEMLKVGETSRKVQTKNQRSSISTYNKHGANLEFAPHHLQSLTKSDLDSEQDTSTSSPASLKTLGSLSKSENADSSVTIQSKPEQILGITAEDDDDDDEDSPEKDIEHPSENPKMSKISAVESDREIKVSGAVSTLGQHDVLMAAKGASVLQSEVSPRSKIETEYEAKATDSMMNVDKAVETLIEEEELKNSSNAKGERKPQADKNVPQEVQKINSFGKSRADSELDTAVIVCPHANDILWEPLSVGDTHFPAMFPAPKLLNELMNIRDAGIILSDSSDGENEDIYAVDDDSSDALGV